ncbi:hypothetical protein [Streptomyces virginiae]
MSVEQWEDGVAFALLENPEKWRLRSVERIELSSHRWSLRTRTLHVGPMQEVNQELANLLAQAPEECRGANGDVRILPPLSQMTKRPVVDFESRVGDIKVSRLSRAEGASLQARYFAHRVNSATSGQLTVGEDLQELLTAIFGSTYPPEGKEVEAYVKEQDGAWITPSVVAVAKLVGCEIASRVMEGRVLPSVNSSAQNPLIALPYLNQLRMTQNLDVLSSEELKERLRSLQLLLASLQGQEESVREPLFKLYGEYGRHWEAFARCNVPLDRPFFVTVSTKRHIQFESPEKEGVVRKVKGWIRPVAWTHARFNDALSSHVNIKVTDMNVELKDGKCEARNELNKPLEVFPDHIHKTRELFAIYSSKCNRDDRLWIKTTLRLGRPTGWIHLLVIATILATLSVTWVVWGLFHSRLTAQQLALLLTPSTFAASLLLVRESSHLSAKFTAPARTVIAVCLAALWAGILFLFVKGEIHVDEKQPAPTSSPQVAPSATRPSARASMDHAR